MADEFPEGGGITLIDLEFLGTPQAIAAYLIQANGATILVESGPATTLPTLEAGLEAQGVKLEDLTHIVVSHIHLDHSGAVGQIVARNPRVQILVHEVGAPHLIDPSRLWRSAGRIYGDDMERLWGEALPVPENQVIPLADDARFRLGDRDFRIRWTAGHASHHLVLLDEATGTLFTGDVGGVHIPGTSYATTPIPPPEVNPPAWVVSIDRIRELAPHRLALTHFGVVNEVPPHLDALLPRLADLVAIGEQAPDLANTDALTETLRNYQVAALGNEATPAVLASLALANPDYLGALGLQRLLRT